ncbi:hypothetical protein ACOTVS_10020 [Aliarcobacter butzleri]
MKKIALGITFFSSLLLCSEDWKQELDIHGGILNNNLSKETSKYFCEYTKKDSLANEILEHFKNQDLSFYYSHKSEIDILPMQLIKSTEKSNLICPSGYIVTGSCGDWKCMKEVEYSKPQLTRIITEKDHKEVEKSLEDNKN